MEFAILQNEIVHWNLSWKKTQSIASLQIPHHLFQRPIHTIYLQELSYPPGNI
jgi:hypothetical protein